MAARFSLEQYGIGVEEIHRNLPPAVLYEHALKWDRGSAISASGALIAMSGVKTGRSPSDKRIVDDPTVAEDVWWGKVNIKLDAASFEINRTRAIDYLNTRERLYVVDGFAGWDPEVPHQGARDLRPAVPRAVHAQHADPADGRASWPTSASPTT